MMQGKAFFDGTKSNVDVIYSCSFQAYDLTHNSINQARVTSWFVFGI
jgi:hypothetical protein